MHQSAKGVRHGLLFVAVLMVGVVALSGCTIPTEPGLPTWDAPVAMPFSQERYGMLGLISNQEDSVRIDSTALGALQFTYSEGIDPVIITKDDLAFSQEASEEFALRTDTLEIDVSGSFDGSMPQSIIIAANDAYDPVGDPDFLPADNVDPGDLAEVDFEEMDSIRVVHVAEGALVLTMNNNSSINWDNVTFTLRGKRLDGSVDPSPLGSFSYNSLAPGATQVDTIVFGDGVGSDSLRGTVVLGITGDYQDQTIDPNAGDLEFSFLALPMKADYAEARLPEQDPITEAGVLPFDQEDILSRAVIDSGAIIFEILNESDIRVDVTLEVPQVYDSADPNADTFRQTLVLGRGSPDQPFDSTVVLDLAGYELRLPADNQQIEMVTTTLIGGTAQGEEFSQVRAGDSIRVNFYTTELKFRRFEGIPKDLSFNLPEQTTAIDFWEDQPDLQEDLAGNLALADVRLNVVFEKNDFSVPVNLVMDIRAENFATGETAVLDTIIEVEPNSSGFTIEGLERLINTFPNQISFGGEVQTGSDHIPGFTDYVVEAGDSLFGEIRIEAPLSLMIGSEGAVLRAEPQFMESTFDEDIMQMTLSAQLLNSIPIGARVYVLAGQFPDLTSARSQLNRANVEEYSLIFNITTGQAGALRLPLPTLDQDGRVLNPQTDTVTVRIPGEKLDIFALEDVYVRQVLELEPTVDGDGNPTAVALYSDDYMLVDLLGQVTYRVNADAYDDSTSGGGN